MKKVFALLLAALLLASLHGCGRRPEIPAELPLSPVPTAAPAPAEPAPETDAPAEIPATAPEAPAVTPDPTPAPPVEAGSYRWDSEEYGVWILNLKANGTFSLICGERIYNGEGWNTAPDGCAVTGPTEAAGAAPFFDEFGSSVWRIDGERCEPVW